MNTDEKNCPFCGEAIKSIAIKCKHCKSELNNAINAVGIERNSKYELVPHGFVVFNILLLIIIPSIIITVSIIIFETGKTSLKFHEIYGDRRWVLLNLVYFISNIMDYYKLKKLGVQVKYGVMTSLFLPPVYLYLRGTALNDRYKIGWGRSQLFFLGWLVFFTISLLIEYYILSNLDV